MNTDERLRALTDLVEEIAAVLGGHMTELNKRDEQIDRIREVLTKLHRLKRA